MTVTTADLIAEATDRLTPTERLVAEAVIDDPTLLAFGTVSDLATRVGTSRPSIVRFAHKLGFDGYTDLQTHARHEMSQQLARPSARIRIGSDETERERVAMHAAVDSAYAALDGGRLGRIAEILSGARNVWIVSGETSRAGAHVLTSGLSMVRGGAKLVQHHAMGRDLAEAGENDAAVILDFYRYRRSSIVAAKALTERDVAVVAVTDGPLSPLAGLAHEACLIEVPGIGPFDSSVSAVAVAELIVAEVAGKLHVDATSRLDRTESMWALTETFVE